MVRKCAFCKAILPDDVEGSYCNEEHKNFKRQRDREYYEKNKDKCINRSKEWKKQHQEERNEYARNYYKENLDLFAMKEPLRAEYKKQWRLKKLQEQVKIAEENLINGPHVSDV